MKWMLSTALVVVAVSAAVVSGQAGKDGKQPKMGEAMNMTYTGCVEAVNPGGSFLLTHVVDDHAAMMHADDMMKSDSKMAEEKPRASNGMDDDQMMPGAVVLTGRSDLKKHVGQKVTVTGVLSHAMSGTMPNDRDTLRVASLKIVAKSCS